MSDIELRLSELLHEAAPPSDDATGLIDGARRYAARARRLRVAAVVTAVVAVVLGVGGVVAIGANRDRSSVPGRLVNTTPPPTLSGHSWQQTATLTGSAGTQFSLVVRATVAHHSTHTTSTASAPAGTVFVTWPGLSGSYELTNTSSAAYDLSTEVTVFAFWKVPAGFCTRFDQYLGEAHLPVPAIGGGQELCPMAMGDSTLPGLPQTLAPGKPLSLPLVPGFIGLNRNLPAQLSPADAEIAVTATGRAPDAWAAFDSELTTRPDGVVFSQGLPTS